MTAGLSVNSATSLFVTDGSGTAPAPAPADVSAAPAPSTTAAAPAVVPSAAPVVATAPSTTAGLGSSGLGSTFDLAPSTSPAPASGVSCRTVHGSFSDHTPCAGGGAATAWFALAPSQPDRSSMLTSELILAFPGPAAGGKGSSGLSTGAIVGIAVGAAAVIALLRARCRPVLRTYHASPALCARPHNYSESAVRSPSSSNRISDQRDASV